jgi:hypothetical protein
MTNGCLNNGFVSTDLTRHLEASVKEYRLPRLTLLDHLLNRWKPDKI